MRLMLDTHLLLWSVGVSARLSAEARRLLEDATNTLLFSSASIWEIAIKASARRRDFSVDARLVRRTLLNSGYIEVPVSGEHAVAIADLPLLHRDPFDRILVAQSITEGITLLTGDRQIARYPGPIQYV